MYLGNIHTNIMFQSMKQYFKGLLLCTNLHMNCAISVHAHYVCAIHQLKVIGVDTAIK